MTGTTSPRVVPAPPKKLAQVSVTESHSSIAEDKDGEQRSEPSSKAFDGHSIQSTAKSLPPPINRADKPKILKKPLSAGNKVCLEPIPTSIEQGVSPFSTPPSSDESQERSSPRTHNSRLMTTPLGTSNNARQLHSHSPSAALTLQGTYPASNASLPTKAQRTDARKFGFNVVSYSDGARLVNPPGLPPRRAQEKRVAVFQTTTGSGDKPYNVSHRPAKQVSPRNSIRQSQSTIGTGSIYLPPPKRPPLSKISSISNFQRDNHQAIAKPPEESSLPLVTSSSVLAQADPPKQPSSANDFPDATITNRRPPHCRGGKDEIDTGYDCKHIDICGQYVATAGHISRVWDLTSGDMVVSLDYHEKELRVTALAFKPAAKAAEEGFRLWLGSNHGEIQEVDVLTNSVIHTNTGTHKRREITRIYRHQNSMWTLDDGGQLCTWSANDIGLPDLHRHPLVQRIPKGHTCSVKIQDTLWLATGQDIQVFRPGATGTAFSILQEPLSQTGVGIVTSSAIISGQLDRVYFGHADGKVTIYSTADFTCLGIVSVSIYKISALAGAGFYLWAGYSTGMVYIYDTRKQPWTTKKEWLAHTGPVLNIVTDRSSLWKTGVLRVASLGADNAVRIWDGTLEEDWIGSRSDIEVASLIWLILMQMMICKITTLSTPLSVRLQPLW